MLKVRNLDFTYRCGTKVLYDVNFSLEKGKFLAILGNNGVGKSTLLKCLNGILKPQKGKIEIDGKNIFDMSRRDLAKEMAFVAQSVPPSEMIVYDAVLLGRKPYMNWNLTSKDHQIVCEAMNKLGVMELRGRNLDDLSGGEKQKVIIARALAQQPKILLLDEPTSSLDLQNQYHVLETVRKICDEAEITIIMIIHDINLALRFCDEFIMLKDGEVYEYGDSSIVNAKSIKDVYNISSKIIDVDGRKLLVVQ